VAKLAARNGTVLGQSAPIAVNDDDRIDQFAEQGVEAPPGFEPGVEVLQLDLTPNSLSKPVDLLNASARSHVAE
jgi:hypothetical protein